MKHGTACKFIYPVTKFAYQWKFAVQNIKRLILKKRERERIYIEYVKVNEIDWEKKRMLCDCYYYVVPGAI